MTPGIHQIDQVRGANCFLVITDSKMLLIDTGLPGNAKRIISYIQGLGKNPQDISHIILTHADIDHIGSAAELRKITGARLVIHAADAAILSGQARFRTIRGPLGVLLKLLTPVMHFQPVEPDIIITESCEISGFPIIHTPGHTRGSISLYSPGKFIFVGDALTRRFTQDAAQAKASSMLISGLEFDVLLPGHRAPVVGRASARLKQSIGSSARGS